MGIQGLTTFINSSNQYLKCYELCDTYLVIDGDNTYYQLYILWGKFNSAFGGDYDQYAQLVSDFFAMLLKCNVTPLVLFDGGWEHKKLKTHLKRMKERIQTASLSYPRNQRIYPIFLEEVFIEVLEKKNIRYAKCLLEADSAIAAVARVLNCPVLSLDSDFFVYGTSYIPFTTLSRWTAKSTTGNSYMMHCKIYRVEYLLNSFQGLSLRTLPLAAVLLGNDYTERSIFDQFFESLKLSNGKNIGYNRIKQVFTWLSNYTLKEAVVKILSRVPGSVRQKVLNLIELNIDTYTNRDVETLITHLGLPIAQVVTPSVNQTFKLDIDLKSLNYLQEIPDEENRRMNHEKEKKEDAAIWNICHKLESVIDHASLNDIPEWFINEFYKAKYWGSLINLFCQHLYICPVLLDYIAYPACNTIGLKILSVTFGILKSETDDETGFMRYIIRNQEKEIVCYKLKATKTVSFINLRNIPITARRDILDNTLGITNKQCINKLLPEWKLYVCCIKYWIEQREVYQIHKYYIYSVLICMFFNIIDSKIGQHRINRDFRQKYDEIIQAVQKRREIQNYKPHYSTDVTIVEALNEVDHDDCLLAAPFFVFHFKTDRILYSNPNEYNISIVHAFSELQICLMLAQELNTLLGSPYPRIEYAKLFNGTLLYNLCNNFKACDSVENYVKKIFQHSPSLFRLFKILLSNLRPLFPYYSGW